MSLSDLHPTLPPAVALALAVAVAVAVAVAFAVAVAVALSLTLALSHLTQSHLIPYHLIQSHLMPYHLGHLAPLAFHIPPNPTVCRTTLATLPLLPVWLIIQYTIVQRFQIAT